MTNIVLVNKQNQYTVNWERKHPRL